MGAPAGREKCCRSIQQRRQKIMLLRLLRVAGGCRQILSVRKPGVENDQADSDAGDASGSGLPSAGRAFAAPSLAAAIILKLVRSSPTTIRRSAGWSVALTGTGSGSKPAHAGEESLPSASASAGSKSGVCCA